MSTDDRKMEKVREYWAEGPGSKKSKEINPDVDNEFAPDEDAPDTDEETGLSSLVGTPTATHTVSGTHVPSSSGGMLGGPWTTSPPFSPIPTYPSTTTGPLLPPPAYPAPSVKRTKPVRLPPEFTEKVLLAFLDPALEDDDVNSVTWAAHLMPLHFELVKDEDGRITLEITFSLEDVYENNDK